MSSRSPGCPVGTATRGFATWLVVIAVVVASFTVPAAATQSAGPDLPVGTDSEIVVELTADGDARVTVVSPFDFQTDAEREAFDRLRSNKTAKSRLLGTYRTRMAAVAERAADRTGREMAISDGRIALTTTPDGSTGFVRLSVTWTGLATTAGNRIELGAPFDRGFSADARFVVVTPEGYDLESVAPQPTTTREGVAAWSPGTDLSGFSLVSRPVDDTGGATATVGDGAVSPGGQPGFGLVAPGVVLVALGLVAHRRRV